jgi:hypothetical protein
MSVVSAQFCWRYQDVRRQTALIGNRKDYHMHHLITPTPGITEWLIVTLVTIIVYGIPIFFIIWFAKKTVENKRENVKLRLEVGKLAEQLELVRRQQQPNKQ